METKGVDTIITTEAGHLPPVSSHCLSLPPIKSFQSLNFLPDFISQFFKSVSLFSAMLPPPNSYDSGASVTAGVTIWRFYKGKKEEAES